MINAIINDFRGSVVFSKSDEVELFRGLAIAIAKHSASTFIDETHGGNVCNVSFTSVIGKKEACEIADLLIISHSPTPGQLRATFWQAKKQATSKWLNVTHSGSQLDFKGQFNQWDLLSRRPLVTGVGHFQPPTDLLSSFSSASIGTFGVFFEKGLTVEVAHSIAEFIACPSPAAKHPTLSINGYLDKYHYSLHEVITRSDLDSFLKALFEFQVGALLQTSESAHQWLVKMVRSKVAQKAPNASVLRVLDGFIGQDGGSDSLDPGPPSGLSILVVGAQSNA